MSEVHDEQDNPTGRSGVYHILVQGTLADHWSGRLGGMTIRRSTVDQAEQGEPLTTLSGWIRDQSQLSGVLNTIVGLHLSILRVERQAGGQPPAAAVPRPADSVQPSEGEPS